MKNKDILKKKIIYRSTHRGTKEMDLLLGNFVKRHINNLNVSDLEDLDKFTQIEDEILQNLYLDKDVSALVTNNNISKMFRDFKI
jgi:antitoxin CptB